MKVGYQFIYFIDKMSSPIRGSSPVRALYERYNSRPLETIAEETNAFRLSSSLIQQKKILQRQNERLLWECSQSRQAENYQQMENTRVREERDDIQARYRELQAREKARRQVQEDQFESQDRQVKLLRDEYDREKAAWRSEISALSRKAEVMEVGRAEEMQALKTRCAIAVAEEREGVKMSLGEDLKQVVGELQLAKQMLGQKEAELNHLIAVSHQNSNDYTANLERLISQNNVLRNQLLVQESHKNKEVQLAETKKQLQKSRTMGILSYCRESNSYMEKELTRLAQQLNQKNISIESFTRELLRQKKNLQELEKQHQNAIFNLKQKHRVETDEIVKEAAQREKEHKEEMEAYYKNMAGLEEKLASKENQVDNLKRELAYTKEQVTLGHKEIKTLKENIANLHDEHSKDLSKVMNDSKVKRRSGLNISSYSSSSLKEIEDQGSSILRIDRKSSLSQVESGKLPIVKEELAISHGHLESDDEDIEIKELILHYQTMIEELKKNKANELELAQDHIKQLKDSLDQKQQEIIEVLNKFSPLMELKVSPNNIEQERREAIEKNKKGSLDVLDVLLNKYQIVSLRGKY